ncbi:MAG TPA: ATPase, T2SS/T4P/T4SS family [Candidatus Wallbacteria bacterium]|nr:ATPase, T2SS/T4P/T4SS family [Candidatus Wallbacteria bacterium]
MKKIKKRLGDILIEKNLITEPQLQDALKQQKLRKQRLGKVLVDLNFVTEKDILNVLSDQFNIPIMDISSVIVDKEVADLIDPDFARDKLVIPLMFDGSHLVIGMADPLDVFSLEKLENSLKMPIDVVICSELQITNIITSVYGAINQTVSALVSEAELQSEQEQMDKVDSEIIELVGRNEENDPVVKLVSEVIKDAAAKRASDVHVEPTEKGLVIRFRIDGVLVHALDVDAKIQNRFIARIKVVAGMDISEKRLPQDGRMQIKFEKTTIDIRVSSLPIVWGEKIVMRLLDRSSVQIGIDTIGFSSENLENFKKALKHPNGIILVTGPTGSGKTSTLYAGLNLIKSPEINIITVENPVEYRLSLINQVQIRADIDYTFATALRSILRQDPDVIMVGEIRDLETANIAIESALTGHLVLSTLHTNDSASTITRFIEMGIQPFLLTSTIIAIVSQRLVRRICPNCREEWMPEEELLRSIKVPPGKFKFYQGKGCQACLNTGYKGRVAIHEILMMNDEIRLKIFDGHSTEEIKRAARSSGMKTMRYDGLAKAVMGITTLSEVMRMTKTDE